MFGWLKRKKVTPLTEQELKQRQQARCERHLRRVEELAKEARPTYDVIAHDEVMWAADVLLYIAALEERVRKLEYR